MSDTSFQLARFLGHFHPVLVHLPLGFLFLLGALEALACLPRYRHLRGSHRAIVVLTIPATLLTALSGWLLAADGSYDADLLAFHRWSGVAVFAGTLGLLVLHLRANHVAFRVCLGLTLALAGGAGHYGGALTHGSDFLTRNAPEPVRSWFGPTRKAGAAPATTTALHSASPAFAVAIQPMLNEYCSSCHGPEKAKGKLRLDSLEAILKGGENGPVVVPGNPDRSPLLQRSLLPLAHDDHMPPDGKPQLSGDDLAILRWWIENGANGTLPADHPSSPAALKQRLAKSPR